MSNEEKTLGQVLWESDTRSAECKWNDLHELSKEELEHDAQAVIAEWLRRNPSIRVDDPEADATDFAHPAWWRGHAHTFKVMVQKINKMLDGEPLHGTAQPEWQGIRERIAELVGQRRNGEEE